MKERLIIGLWRLSLFTLVCLSIFAGCKGESMDDCFTNSGETVTENRQASPFNKIELYNNVNLVIEKGDQYSIRVEGSKNILSAIKTTLTDTSLVITNTLKCNWARDYDHEITVYVCAPSLNTIHYEASGNLSTKGQLFYDFLEVNAWGGSGSINMNLDCNVLKLALHYGTVDFNIEGSSRITTIYANSYGPFDCANLISNIMYIGNSGTNDCRVHALHILHAQVSSVGNIYYSGNPHELNCSVLGSGKIIKVD